MKKLILNDEVVKLNEVLDKVIDLGNCFIPDDDLAHDLLVDKEFDKFADVIISDYCKKEPYSSNICKFAKILRIINSLTVSDDIEPVLKELKELFEKENVRFEYQIID